MAEKPIGYVMVDSGEVIIADPAYAMSKARHLKLDDGIQYKEIEFPQSLREAAEAAGLDKDPQAWGKSIGSFDAQSVGGIVVSKTYIGDGSYPVYAEKNDDGEVVALTIRFDESQEASVE